jgi:acetylornithine deacetylase
VIPGEDREVVVAQIREFLQSRLDFEFTMDPPWLQSGPLGDVNNGWLADAVLSHAGDAHQKVGVPYGTHASRTAAAGVPSVVFGPGSIEQAHTKDEFIAIDQLEQAAEVYFHVCAQPPARPA